METTTQCSATTTHLKQPTYTTQLKPHLERGVAEKLENVVFDGVQIIGRDAQQLHHESQRAVLTGTVRGGLLRAERPQAQFQPPFFNDEIF